MSKRLLFAKAFVSFSGMRIIAKILVVAALASFAACHSAPKKQDEHQIISADTETPLAARLDRNLDKAFGAWNDSGTEQLLTAMLGRIASADPAYAALKDAHVHLLDTTTPYIAPGLAKTVYVSRGALGAVLYENELAFLLATQLAFLHDHATKRNLAVLQGQEVGEHILSLPTSPAVMHRDYLEKGWFEAGGLFDVGNVVYLKAEADGIKLMYAAKYDPRGAVALIQRWTAPPLDAQLRALGKILPEPDERLNQAREEVAKLSPLRDPIVRSHAFEELEARLHVKKAKARKKNSK
ncbi:MAG: hypothetical protein HY075_14380 [Deltaproteobacteria bacterium]|nr:hypothetical protein [Deltaproteobacteria bacterium]